MYLDDLLTLLASMADTNALATALFDLFHQLGIQCHRTKSKADLVARIKYLGFLVDVSGCQLLLCKYLYEKLETWVTALLVDAHCHK